MNRNEMLPSVEESRIYVEKLRRRLNGLAKEDKLRRIYNLVHDIRTLTYARTLVQSNTGASTCGVDGITRWNFSDEDLFDLQDEIKSLKYQPLPVRRAYIPKNKGRWRPLGIPAYRDRIVQMAVKLILEPIAEAHFLEQSIGFRPNRGAWDGLAYTGNDKTMQTYHWIVEGDIKGAFDNINHFSITEQIQQWLSDNKLVSILVKFMKSPIAHCDKQSDASDLYKITRLEKVFKGTPQGGVISPLLFNIGMHSLDLWYNKNFNPVWWLRNIRPDLYRETDAWCRRKGFTVEQYLYNYRTGTINNPLFRRENRNFYRGLLGHIGKVVMYIRYADDFIFLIRFPKSFAKNLVSGNWSDWYLKPIKEKVIRSRKGSISRKIQEGWKEFLIKNYDGRNLIEVLNQLGLSLSLEKTKITNIASGYSFLGIQHQRWAKHRVAYRQLPNPENFKKFRKRLRELTSLKANRNNREIQRIPTTDLELVVRVNRMVKGWWNYYRHCHPIRKTVSRITNRVYWRVRRWLKRRHNLSSKQFKSKYQIRKRSDNGKMSGHIRVFDKDKNKWVYLVTYQELIDLHSQARQYSAYDWWYRTEFQPSTKIKGRNAITWQNKDVRYNQLYWENRLSVLHRDEWTCRQCGAQSPLEVDHIQPLPKRKQWKSLSLEERVKYHHPNNLQTLCRSCHSAKTSG